MLAEAMRIHELMMETSWKFRRGKDGQVVGCNKMVLSCLAKRPVPAAQPVGADGKPVKDTTWRVR